ncbi:hypothetical protein HPP92_000577 [Vanilla planifolia]|nr:hypothetical protein HPP92_000577 [Vanilla planifolia]
MVMTYHGHEKSVSFLSMARHKTSLLVSMSRDSRVRVWDTGASSSTGASSCVGMTSVPGSPVSMKCYDSLCYVAAGTTVTAVDLRTMRSVATVAIHSPKIYSFEMLPSKWLLCTGGEEKAILWDIRKNQTKPYPVAELQGHSGPVKLLHMDSYKVVTGGPNDNQINVWETDSGHLANVLQAYDPPATFSSSEKSLGVSALAVDGCRLVISDADQGFIAIRDFSQCSIPILASPSFVGSKFWQPQNYSDD